MIAPSYTYKAKIISVYDADSFTALVDLGMRVSMTVPLRLFGINAPEIRGSEKEAGNEAKEFVKSLILNKEVTIKTYKNPEDKYGRWLAEVIGDFGENYPKNLTALLLSKGMGIDYYGD